MVTEGWSDELTAHLSTAFGDRIKSFERYLGQDFLTADAPAIPEILGHLKSNERFDYLVDITAVDYPQRAERFDLIYIVYSYETNRRIRLKARVKDAERPPSVAHVHLTANWLEREIFDMFGIEFDGHPDLRRILMPEEWQGHPLRKDYSILQMDQRWVRENLGIESAQ